MSTARRLGIGMAVFAGLFLSVMVGTLAHLEGEAWERINGHWEARVEAYRDFYAERALVRPSSLWGGKEGLRERAVLDLSSVGGSFQTKEIERDLWGGRWRRSRKLYLRRLPPRQGLQGLPTLTYEAERVWFSTELRARAYLIEQEWVDPRWSEELIDIFQEIGVELVVEWS